MVTQEATPAKAKPTRIRMSYEEFREWADEDTHAEWVDGEAIVFMPAKDVHQNTLEFLYELLALFARLFNLGKVRVAPFEMKLRQGRSYREPDILFLSEESRERLTEDRLEGPADLVIEIISGDSVRRDREDKFKEYQEAGIQEYWVIDPRSGKQRADFFRLNTHGQYELIATEDDERVESAVLPGFWLRPSWLWQAGELDPLLALGEMAGLPDNAVQQFRQQIKAGLQKSDK